MIAFSEEGISLGSVHGRGILDFSPVPFLGIRKALNSIARRPLAAFLRGKPG